MKAIPILLLPLFLILSCLKAQQLDSEIISGDLAKLGLTQFKIESCRLISEKTGLSLYYGSGVVDGKNTTAWAIGTYAYYDWLKARPNETEQSTCAQFLRRMENYEDDMALGRERKDIIYRTVDRSWGG
jgi:hypothetical protein